MAILIGLSTVAVALFTAWVVGEIRNIRALRLPGAMALLMIAPLAYFVGLATGHESGYFESRARTSEFMGAVADALRSGDSAGVLVEAERLRHGADEPRKTAGGFFYHSIESATQNLAGQTIQRRRAE